MQAEGTEVGVGPKTENQKIEEKKRPSAIIKAILSTVNIIAKMTLPKQGELSRTPTKPTEVRQN